MAEAVVSQNSEIVSNETGVLKQAGSLVTQVRKMYGQPAFQRSLPTTVALVVPNVAACPVVVDLQF